MRAFGFGADDVSGEGGKEEREMIFYFSGTGNSLMAAKALAREGENIVDMAAARKAGAYVYPLEGERIGFVFPVYCYTIPSLVLDFIRHLEIKDGGYAFAVVTCGGGIGGTSAFLAKELGKRGVSLSYATPLLMPDNAVFYYAIKPKAEIDARLEEAEKRLGEIKKEIESERKKRARGAFSKALYPMYRLLSKTEAFFVTDVCVHCGLCARNCPEEAIKMTDGKPEWVKKSCVKCAACINRCPVAAIEYGKGTEKRGRYVNPILRGGDKA